MRRMLRTLSSLAASVVVLVAATASSADELVVIVNSANPNASLSAQQVKAYFLKRTDLWANGEKVRPVDRDGESPERTALLSRVLGLSSDELKRYWIERQYANADHPPASVPDEASVVKFVAFFKGGIGFVTRAGLRAGADGVKPVLTLSY